MDAVTITAGPLLVPGAAGRATVLTEYRELVLALLSDLAASAPGLIQVVAAGSGPAARSPRASLAPYGVADRHVGWTDLCGQQRSGDQNAGPDASVAILALRAAGWTGPIDVIEIDAGVVDIDTACEAAGSAVPLVVVGTAPNLAGGRWMTRRVDTTADSDCALYVHDRL